MSGPNTLQFTDDNFDAEVLQASTPVLVDFWAEWCQPCKALGPTIDELATEYNGKMRVGKLDTDVNQDAAKRYQISAIPTVLMFKGGQIVERFTGVRTKKDIAAAMDRVLG